MKQLATAFRTFGLAALAVIAYLAGGYGNFLAQIARRNVARRTLGFMLLGGRVSDVLGRRRAFVAALVVYALSSLAGGLAPDQLELGEGQVDRFAMIAARHADNHRQEIEEQLG